MCSCNTKQNLTLLILRNNGVLECEFACNPEMSVFGLNIDQTYNLGPKFELLSLSKSFQSHIANDVRVFQPRERHKAATTGLDSSSSIIIV